MIDIHLAQDNEEIKKALKIREEVFIKGQNVPADLENDGLDNISEHVLLYVDSIPVGTSRIRYDHNKMRLERIAVLENFRGRGLGNEMMKFLVSYGKQKKVVEIYMHAQYYLLDFYRKFGFEPRGDKFIEADIEHIEMYLRIN